MLSCLLLGDTGGEAGATHPTTVISARAVHANALELAVRVTELKVRHNAQAPASRGQRKRPYDAYMSAYLFDLLL
jgi:hypothetical protein